MKSSVSSVNGTRNTKQRKMFDRSFFRDMFKALAVIFIMISCGQSLYYINDITENSNGRKVKSKEKSEVIHQNDDRLEYYYQEEKLDSDTVYVYY